ncbi:MAG: response regulator transcription factor [Saprospiraceae bacterium]|jgi:DNA-binding response OmpR family regulator
MKLLFAEDSETIRNQWITSLKKEGFVCEQSGDFKNTLLKIINYEYDCVILNEIIKGGNTLELVEVLQTNMPTTGILLYSESNNSAQRTVYLEKGADDFLVLPFQIPEFIARIKAILRRKTGQPERIVTIGNLIILLDQRQVNINETPVTLTRKEFDILIHLIRNKNRVVTKDSIAEHLWGDYMDDVDSYDFIYAHVKNIRKKLTAHQCGNYIKTIYGVGYKFSLN